MSIMITSIKFIKRKKILLDFIIIAAIILLPFLFYLYNYVPKLETWEIGSYKIESGYYHDVNFYAWYLSVKILTLSTLGLWFITCNHKWQYVLFVPITLEIYKIIAIIGCANHGFDYSPNFMKSFYYAIPLCMLLVLLSRKLGYSQQNLTPENTVNKAINSEIINLSKFNFKDYKRIKKELITLRSKRKKMDDRTYLINLLKLRDQMSTID